MKKLNNKGFALAEILVVTVFVMIIFSIIYTNFYPIMAEYERRESYDDVDGKYAAYWFKKMIEKEKLLNKYAITSSISTNKYYQFKCDDLSSDKILCNNLVDKYEVAKDASGNIQVYITEYDTDNFKTKIQAISTASSGFKEYVAYLPRYDGDPGHRIIIEFHRTKGENDYYAYATMEVSA